ncbi:hypothetical protein A2933_00060 [Candidatus Nomurabacteria bacterium RIFCSPLOWO2_01_FULL_46_18]|uniref:Ada DNA repair metal-binding domain-containing protein n=1 Tax=Candidatus Nomurabacteria bacterium RIFCSPLOWO2_01_FULL_46_18 TaxID=1801783 RepID=A0A1F6XET4_9BACT|nr:MAG: hypothetical protein A2933_00060 [Candidatus Nomurabacteria bacterium RIFCSPLOWO2_01_FULL_46_18]
MEKIKAWLLTDRGKDIVTIIIVVLVGLGSFELGRLSKESDSSGIKIEYPNQEANVLSASEKQVVTKFNQLPSVGKTFFASSRGQKYYSIGCTGGKTIKQENRIYFTTAEEAERAGYELSSTCK